MSILTRFLFFISNGENVLCVIVLALICKFSQFKGHKKSCDIIMVLIADYQIFRATAKFYGSLPANIYKAVFESSNNY